jgi:hypothetical protein
MQKLVLVLLIAPTLACGARRPTTTAAPAGTLQYESEGALASASFAERGERAGPAPAASTERLVARSPSAVGDFVRTRSAQLNFCYTEALGAHPNLAGAVGVAVTITSAGDVTDVVIVRRSWVGQGTEPLETCIRTKIRGWKFPPADAPTGTYPVSLSFTR